jgi:hypothetical protein
MVLIAPWLPPGNPCGHGHILRILHMWILLQQPLSLEPLSFCLRLPQPPHKRVDLAFKYVFSLHLQDSFDVPRRLNRK